MSVSARKWDKLLGMLKNGNHISRKKYKNMGLMVGYNLEKKGGTCECISYRTKKKVEEKSLCVGSVGFYGTSGINPRRDRLALCTRSVNNIGIEKRFFH